MVYLVEMKNWVWCLKCLEWVDTNKITFVNIEEDIHGIDSMTFICDECEQESKSKVISKETQPRSQ